MQANDYPSLNFNLGEMADMLRDSVRSFTSDKITPRAAEIDETNVFPRDLWPLMGELGLHGITVPEEYGGAGMGYLEQRRGDGRGSLAVRRRSVFPMARTPTCVSIRLIAMATMARNAVIAETNFRRTPWRTCNVGTGSGSDVVSMRTKAEKKGDRYILNGNKM